MTHADGHFAIGKSHVVCQDYVRTGRTPDGRAYVIVADGCSSSKDTDLGARLLVLATETFITTTKPSKTTHNAVNFDIIASIATKYANHMGLHPTCLDATLLVAIETETHIAVSRMGDGVVAARERTGAYQYSNHEFASGAPFYTNYLQHEDRLQALYDLPNNHVFMTQGIVGVGETKDQIEMGDYATMLAQPVLYAKADFDLVVLMTDGALSFRKGLEPVPVTDIVTQILDVKVPTGEFMLRRAKKFLGSYCTQQGWDHYDDFGVGAVFIDAPDMQP